ncbi:hypothetical protein ACQP1K_08570 [Sphaerimonospora sp. CA-214678]|uniref:hypothetical protein n=1 Tax=Sphaerimonospora sp. CA-214678 TaxID=3240029 RepID=UPI003D8CEB8D
MTDSSYSPHESPSPGATPPPLAQPPQGSPPTPSTPSDNWPKAPPPDLAAGGYSGIDPTAMDAFEKGLGRVEAALGRDEPRLRRMLQRLDLDTSRLAVLREAQGWIATTRPDLRRRSETIRAEQTEWAASSAGHAPGMTGFDEELYGKAAHDPDVYAAISRLTDAAEAGEVDDTTVAALEKRMGDPTFALALMNALGPVAFRGLMTETVGREGDKNVQRVQTALGKTLGTASSRLSTTWRDGLTSGLAGGRKEVYAISRALEHGKFGNAFLVSTARKIDAWDRSMSKLPIDAEHDPMVPLMKALSRDAAAAQDFFTGDPTALKHFLTERAMPDEGKALGTALEAAMLTFRDHDGSPEEPSCGYLSAKLASEFVHLQAERIRTKAPPDSFVPHTTTANVLAAYIADVNRVVVYQGDETAPGVTHINQVDIPGPPLWGPRFERGQLSKVAQEAFGDAKAFAAVMAAQTAFAGRILDHGAAKMAAGQGDMALRTEATWIGWGFGFITNAAGLAKIEEGKELDERQERNAKILTGTLNSALAIPQKAAWPITAGVVGAWTGMIEDSLKGHSKDQATDEANATVRKNESIMRDLAVQAFLKHDLFGPSDSPGPTHPWASLEGLKKGDDPRDNPSNFLKDDGRTLMSRDEMIDKTTPGLPDRERRYDAYRRWMNSESYSGKRWSQFMLKLNQAYSRAFDKFSS